MRAFKPQELVFFLLLSMLIGCGGSSRSSPGTGWFQVTAPGPSPRWAPMAVFDSERRQVVLYGGAGGGAEVWLFSFDQQTWQRIDAPNGPPPLDSAGAVADMNNDRMIIFGGFSTAASNGTWAFSFANHTWSSLPTGPSGRFDIGATTDGQHAWFYGGYLQGFVPVNELWQFDLSSNSWSLLPQGQTLPSPRTNMAIGFLPGFLYMTGGHDLDGLTPGTWRYNLTSSTWAQLTPTGTPGAGGSLWL
jgi:Galactose oxidase, central domain